MTVMKLKEPFPGTYSFIRKVKPTELDVAAEIEIPGMTAEPWQFHYPPFKEKLIVKKGMLLVQKPAFCASYDESVRSYGKDECVSIPAYAPHRLVNAYNRKLVFVVESSPGPEHRLDLEPDYKSLTECIDALHRALVAEAKKHIFTFQTLRS